MDFELTDRPDIEPAAPPARAWADTRAGACVTFEGRVRRAERGSGGS
jgi:molybdopterin synthase catalytic subunit